MIIQALYQHYQRMADDPDSGISRPGYSKAKVSFALVLSAAGEVVELIDLRTRKGSALRPAEMDVPEQTKRTVKVQPNFLCDTSPYLFGAVAKGKAQEKDKTERCKQAYEEFRKLHREVIDTSEDTGLRAALGFLDRYPPGEALDTPALNAFRDDLLAGAFLAFRLDGETGYIHDRPAAKLLWETYRNASAPGDLGQCLVTGQRSPIARVHQSIKGVRDAQSSGAALVSFNIDAFTSYGKDQSLNAPISQPAMFAYTTALNHLLASDRQRIQIGDATTIFWAERDSPAESLIADLFDPPDEREEEPGEEKKGPVRDPATIRQLRELLKCAREGLPISQALPDADPTVRYYVLGLAPNNARLAVRFWHMSTLEELARRIGRHYADLEIERAYASDPEYISAWRILRETAVLGKTENIPPLLGGALMRSILTGAAYPQALFTAILTRIRADHTINYIRAAVVKACLARTARQRQSSLKEATMTLIEESSSVGYRLGRLFAMLEKAQSDATPGLNATIRDRYFGAASATPGSVFPILIRMAQHHVAKAEYGRYTDKRIEEIVAGLECFPSHLTLEEQGLFILGYYHQRQALYQKNTKEN